jgi:hypothetical protein
LLQCYATDPKKAKRSLTNSPICPEFPESEWTNVLAGRAVNLDHVLSGYYSISNNDERTEHVGEVEIKFGTISPTKVVSTAGDWSIAWNRTSRATTVAFPHRAGELGDYSEYIIGLFGATDILFHDRVIAYDRALRRRVGSRRDLELTDIHKFGDLKQLHMDSTGAAAVLFTPPQVPSGTDWKTKFPSGSERFRSVPIRIVIFAEITQIFSEWFRVVPSSSERF